MCLIYDEFSSQLTKSPNLEICFDTISLPSVPYRYQISIDPSYILSTLDIRTHIGINYKQTAVIFESFCRFIGLWTQSRHLLV